MGHHDHRVALLQLADKLLNLRRGNGIQSARGFVKQQHLGLHGQGAGDTQALLLAAGQAERVLLQAILQLVPDGGRAQRLLYNDVQIGLGAHPMAAGTEGNIVVDAHREGVRLLEHHAHAPAQVGRIQRAVGVGTVQKHRAFHATALHQIIHAVQRLQQRGLTATGRADERRHLVFWEGEVDIAQTLEVAVEQVQVLDGHLRRSGCGLWNLSCRGDARLFREFFQKARHFLLTSIFCATTRMAAFSRRTRISSTTEVA